MRLLPYKIRKLVFKKLRSKAEKLKNAMDLNTPLDIEEMNHTFWKDI